MPELIHQFLEPFVDPETERQFSVRVHARREGNAWNAWIEFYPLDVGPPLRTVWETDQPSAAQLAWWAKRLSDVYLAGAFRRAQGVEKRFAPVSSPSP